MYGKFQLYWLGKLAPPPGRTCYTPLYGGLPSILRYGGGGGGDLDPRGYSGPSPDIRNLGKVSLSHSLPPAPPPLISAGPARPGARGADQWEREFWGDRDWPGNGGR